MDLQLLLLLLMNSFRLYYFFPVYIVVQSKLSSYLQQDLLGDKDEDGNTPLMLAIESGSLDTAKLLIERGKSYIPAYEYRKT